MRSKDPRIDAYIEKSQEFARPILRHLRKVIHRGCPDATETIKWGCPFFDYHGLLCGFAAFKAHCSLFFWRDIDVSRWTRTMKTPGVGMGQFGKITALSDLPSAAALVACVRAATAQRNAPKPVAKRVRQPAKELPVPADLRSALAGNAKAAATFRRLPRVIGAPTSSGSPTRNAPRRAHNDRRLQSSGWPRENRRTGRRADALRLATRAEGRPLLPLS